METKQTFRITPQFVLGALVVLLGVLLTLDNLDVIDARSVLRYWPLILVIYGAMKIIQPDTNAARFWGFFTAFIGLGLLGDKLDLFNFRLRDFWPLFLVALGALMLWRTSARNQMSRTVSVSRGGHTDSNSYVNASAILGGVVRNVQTQDFRGGEFTAIMGGCDIDLRNAAIANSPAVVNIFAFWGGIEIKIPQHWSVTFEGTPILGGLDDKTFRQGTEATQQLIVRGTIIMGGVELRN